MSRETNMTCQFCGTKLVVCHEFKAGKPISKEEPLGTPDSPERTHCNHCGICFEEDGKNFFEGYDPRIMTNLAAPVPTSRADNRLVEAHDLLQTEHSKALNELKQANTDADLLAKENEELRKQLEAATAAAASAAKAATPAVGGKSS